jgi:hypothetical protein
MGVQSWGCPGRAGSALAALGVSRPRRECPESLEGDNFASTCPNGASE